MKDYSTFMFNIIYRNSNVGCISNKMTACSTLICVHRSQNFYVLKGGTFKNNYGAGRGGTHL